MFITFEGTEGSGKTTQIQDTYTALRELGHNVLLTREPGGTEIGDAIRTLLLDTPFQNEMSARAELMLFCASRAQLVDEVIRPHLQAGGVVLCDRYTDSTLAYQGYAHDIDPAQLQPILDFATGNLFPDVTVFLDIAPERGLERRRQGMLLSAEDWNRMDDKELAYHRRVYAGYQQLIAADEARFVRVNADDTPQNVQQTILSALVERLPDAAPAGD